MNGGIVCYQYYWFSSALIAVLECSTAFRPSVSKARFWVRSRQINYRLEGGYKTGMAMAILEAESGAEEDVFREKDFELL